MKKTLGIIFLLLLLLTTPVRGQNNNNGNTELLPVDSLLLPDSVIASISNRSFWDKLKKGVRSLSQVDTSYIEPQRYNFMAMLQNTNTYESYSISSANGDMSIKLSPEPNVKLGPYFGWRWIFLGYTLDLSHLDNGRNRQDFVMSLYSNQIGADLFYRKTGDEFKIRELVVNGQELKTMKKVPFSGLHASIVGGNIYYIFNHRKFSYPAAFNQSTRQKRSAGSMLAGIGYTRHTLEVDWESLDNLVEKRLGDQYATLAIDSSVYFGKIKYTDVSVSCGYAYNWVFAHNWLLGSSLTMALAYKHTSSDTQQKRFRFKDFHLNNINIDAVGRLGLVWNNSKVFAGFNAIVHSYNYKKKEFSTNSMFGSVNIYVGFNFGKK